MRLRNEDVVTNDRFGPGARVRWNRGQGVGRGRITERFEDQVERTIEGSRVRRHGSTANPAYLVMTDNGGEVLKLASELSQS